MQIVDIPPEDLHVNERNSRTHSDEQIDQICASITEFGFTNPILINPDNRIIAGHGRHMAALRLKWDEVPCIVLEGLTEAQERAYVIADNNIALNSSWDLEMLKLELNDLEEFSFDVSLLGFDDDKLAEIWTEDGEMLDYSILDDSGVEQTLENMKKGVRKAIQIEFTPEDFEQAKTLCAAARGKDIYIGKILIEALQKHEN